MIDFLSVCKTNQLLMIFALSPYTECMATTCLKCVVKMSFATYFLPLCDFLV